MTEKKRGFKFCWWCKEEKIDFFLLEERRRNFSLRLTRKKAFSMPKKRDSLILFFVVDHRRRRRMKKSVVNLGQQESKAGNQRERQYLVSFLLPFYVKQEEVTRLALSHPIILSLPQRKGFFSSLTSLRLSLFLPHHPDAWREVFDAAICFHFLCFVLSSSPIQYGL